jgi:hypothetical protein
VAAFYGDENFRYPVVEALRRLGHDVVTCQETGRAGMGIDDEMVLHDALKMGRILMTQNRADFRRLHRNGRPHQGIVVCTYDPDAEALARSITDAVSQEEPGGRWLASVVRPNPPRGVAKKR